MIKAILFDVDGVVVNPQLVFAKNLISDYNITANETDNFFKSIFQECLVGKADLKEELPKYLKEWGWPKTTDELINYWLESDNNIDPNLMSSIQRLRKRGIKCYLATNQEKYRTDYMIDKMGFSKSFDGIFTSANLGHKKPSQEFFKKVRDEIKGIEPSKIMFWDNTKYNVEAAKKIGFGAKLYTNYNDFKIQMKEYL